MIGSFLRPILLRRFALYQNIAIAIAEKSRHLVHSGLDLQMELDENSGSHSNKIYEHGLLGLGTRVKYLYTSTRCILGHVVM